MYRCLARLYLLHSRNTCAMFTVSNIAIAGVDIVEAHVDRILYLT
jgi:hypothetical protein